MIPLQLAAARLMAAQKRPYFSTALFSMTPIERKGLNTLSVDQRWRVYYDPIVFDYWSLEELAGVLIHEVSHLLREHGERCAEVGADEKLWNTAADLEINSTLLREDLVLPSEGVFPVKLGLPEGLLAEEYYERLQAEQQKESEKPAEPNSQNDSEASKANEPQTQDNQQDSQQNNQQDNQPNQSSEESQSSASSESNSQEDSSDESKTASTPDESSLGDNNASDDSSGSESGSNDSNNSEGASSSSSNQGDKGTTQTTSEGDTDTDDSSKSESSTDATSNESDLSGDSNGSSGDKPTTANTETTSQSSTSQAGEGDEAQAASPRPSCGSCGSCATGISQEFEDEIDEECPGLSPIEVAKTKQDTARHILQASGRGTVPAGWLRWAEKQASPKVNWRRELAATVRRSISDTVGMTDYSYARPSRRQAAFNEVIVPGMRKPNLLISVVIDTSGSISDVLVGQILKEVELILKTTGQEQVQIITCDSSVHFNKKVRKVSDIKFLGGGGTDMRVGIQTALESKPRPQIIIVITDGATPWPPASPKNTKVVVALLGNSYDSCVPSWAKKIIVS